MNFIVTKETIRDLPEREQPLMVSLLDDLKDINKMSPLTFVITYDSEGTKYYPIPYYRIAQVDINSKEQPLTGETLGIEMSIEDLDMALCVLSNYTELVKAYE